MPGPLPNPERRRRNAPTIPTTELPSKGRKGRAPDCPYELGASARAWWSWAWHTPQAAAWSTGDLYAIARRAQLEDDLVALNATESSIDLADFLGLESAGDVADQLRWLIGSLKALAGGRLAVAREMRDLDDRLGLTPKGMAALRWKIVAEVPAGEADDDDEVSARRRDREARLGA